MQTGNLDTLFLLLPLMAALAGLFAFPYAAQPASRHYALGASLALSLLAGLIALLKSDSSVEYFTPTMIHAAFMIVVVQVVAAPLLDRTRLLGLVGGSMLAMLAIMDALIDELPMIMPLLERSTWLLAALIAASLCGLIGSALLPTHPARAARGEKLPLPLFTYPRSFGVLLLAITIGSVDWANDEMQIVPTFLVPALTAALYPLLIRPGANRLHAATEGVLAGTIIALLMPQSGPEGVAYGIIAAVLVERGVLIANALRLDDPARLTGTILLPAIAGLLLPYLNNLSTLSDALEWLGAGLLTGIIVALVVWFGVKLTVGFAAAPKRVREGLDYRL